MEQSMPGQVAAYHSPLGVGVVRLELTGSTGLSVGMDLNAIAAKRLGETLIRLVKESQEWQ